MKIIHKQRSSKQDRCGGALVMAAFAIATMSVLALSMVSMQVSSAAEQARVHQEARAVLAAEAGLSRAYMSLQNGGNGNLGAAGQPLALANGEVSVTSQAFTAPSKLMRVTATAQAGHSSAGAELILRDNVNTQFVWGAFGDMSLDLASQAKVDSYDSTKGSYASQVVNGSGSNSWADNKGNIGSNGNVGLKQNALVKGNAVPGQSSTISVIGNASVSGSTANASAPTVFPAIVLPTIASAGNKTFSANTTLPAGSYHFGTTVVNGNRTVTINGPATIVLDSFEMKSGSNFRINSTGGPVDIYVKDSFIMASNTLFAANNYDPRAVRMNMLSDNIADPGVIVQLDTVALNSNGQFFGTIYAPEAKIDIQSNFEIFGALIAKEVVLASNSRVHYDEALGKVLNNGQQRYTCLSWRTLH